MPSAFKQEGSRPAFRSWSERFLKSLNAERIALARQSLQTRVSGSVVTVRSSQA